MAFGHRRRQHRRARRRGGGQRADRAAVRLAAVPPPAALRCGCGYDGSASSGSNAGPLNEDFLDAIDERVAAYRDENGLPDGAEVPVDAVTASGSGLDPHISIANARLQAPRVAAARGLPVEDVLAVIEEHTDDRGIAVLGEPGVNVLLVNVALDELSQGG
ncbi:MAG: potassium-transporting ATPase subunit C [Ilumatobacteraceae bacterium]